jgi:predicted lipoprotein with Yx(FWY)xxD motif
MRITQIIPAGVACLVAGSVLISQTTAGAHAASTARIAVAPTVSLRSTAYGKILVNSKGLTLYLWVKDTKDKSACSGACLDVWPFVLVSGKPTAGPGVKASLLGTIKEKGGHEVTYNGHPLYTFTSDTKPGIISGEGNATFGGPWWVVSAAGNAITKKP